MRGAWSTNAKSLGSAASVFLVLLLSACLGDGNTYSEGRGTSPYQQLAEINASLARTYPDNFLDIRKLLVDHYNPFFAPDVQDYNKDVPPTSLRNDDQHLNDQGYGIVARQVANFIAAKGW